MYDSALAALLERRLGQVQRADSTKPFDAASLRAILSSLPDSIAKLPAGNFATRPELVERLQRLLERVEREDMPPEGLQWRLEEVLRSTLSRIR